MMKGPCFFRPVQPLERHQKHVRKVPRGLSHAGNFVQRPRRYGDLESRRGHELTIKSGCFSWGYHGNIELFKHRWLVGGIFNPSEKWWTSSVAMTKFPIWWESHTPFMFHYWLLYPIISHKKTPLYPIKNHVPVTTNQINMTILPFATSPGDQKNRRWFSHENHDQSGDFPNENATFVMNTM